MVASLLYPGNLGTDMLYLSLMFVLCILLGFVQHRENYKFDQGYFV